MPARIFKLSIEGFPLNRFQLAACGGGEIVEKGLELFDGERRFEELSGVESSS